MGISLQSSAVKQQTLNRACESLITNYNFKNVTVKFLIAAKKKKYLEKSNTRNDLSGITFPGYSPW